jgi:hypothetical protein
MPSRRQQARSTVGEAAGDAAGMQLRDEYSANFEDDGGETFVLDVFQLESGRIMHRVPVRFKTWGTLNGRRDNVLVVCHALTGNGASSHPPGAVPARLAHLTFSDAAHSVRQRTPRAGGQVCSGQARPSTRTDTSLCVPMCWAPAMGPVALRPSIR